MLMTKTITFSDYSYSAVDKATNEWLAKQIKNADKTRFKIISITSYGCADKHSRCIVYEILE